MQPRPAHRTTGSVALALVAAPLAAALAVAGGAAPGAQEPEPLPLTVMTFNIRTSLNSAEDGENGWPHRRALVADTIARVAPEVAGLQEALADQLEYLSAKLPDYRWLGVDRGLNGGEGLSEHVPIFYRYRELLPVESGTFWLSPTPAGPTGTGFRRRVSRIVTWAHFHHVGADRRFYVYNTHLTLRRGERQVNSATMIAERIAGLPAGAPVLAIGDFNSTAEHSDTWRAATATGLRDAWLLADRRIGPARTSSDFRPPEQANEGRIDWILVGGPIGVRSVETVIDHDNARYPSDHYPVVARVLLH
ncbi:MAG: endonuclease/exonuclease/phosphatase family protein [Acidobacteria bacterium]|nr:endonuclease/exonuclease/phosphatase family protein [Acidobacteriota bacterium]MYD69469.1 endonuclease/exonuclease/phosphatase family protein [Acidobacteriota bacterium]MYJ04497.1 endonuclease/exonuclease/phosphatase family protein [Acidobacteriota bacterium]